MITYLSPTYRALFHFSTHRSILSTKKRTTTQKSPTASVPASYSERLGYYRKLRGWSRKDAADAIFDACSLVHPQRLVGISPKTIGKWERGEAKPDSFYIRYLCEIYGVTADKLGLLQETL
jgi:ribosome-binding protein aMBF1 (putative translation factor)